MSTIILGRLAKREPTLRAATDTTYWLEALAAVIPGETLAAYAVIIAFFTKDENGAASFTKARFVGSRWDYSSPYRSCTRQVQEPFYGLPLTPSDGLSPWSRS